MNNKKIIRHLNWDIKKLKSKLGIFKWLAFLLALAIVLMISLSSCSSTSHTYKGCDGKKKFKSQMSF